MENTTGIRGIEGVNQEVNVAGPGNNPHLFELGDCSRNQGFPINFTKTEAKVVMNSLLCKFGGAFLINGNEGLEMELTQHFTSTATNSHSDLIEEQLDVKLISFLCFEA